MPTTRTALPHKVKVVENIFIPLDDGTRLAAKVWKPDAPGRFPAILEYIPYRKRDGTRTRDQGMHMYLAGHGYVCLRLDIRGSGDSDGLIDALDPGCAAASVGAFRSASGRPVSHSR